MFVFYSTEIGDTEGKLLEEDLHHCLHVLRHKIGDTIHVTNGNGLIVSGIIEKIAKSQLTFSIVASHIQAADPLVNTLCVSPPKSGDRLEWMIEKATEIGIGKIYLFECARTERSRINLPRLQKIAIGAMKQSKQYYIPEIQYYNSFQGVLEAVDGINHKCIAFCEEKSNKIQDQIVIGHQVIMIGPEGDFTHEEITMAKGRSFHTVSLGRTILRTETAAIYAATLMENKKF